MTRVDTGPHDDQAAAKQRDLERLVELASPHPTEAEVTEAVGILKRLGDITENPAETQERQKMLLHLAQLETEVRELLAQGDYRWRKGKIVRDPQTGQPLRNLATDRRLRARLGELERLRARITGLPPAGDDQPHAD